MRLAVKSIFAITQEIGSNAIKQNGIVSMVLSASKQWQKPCLTMVRDADMTSFHLNEESITEQVAREMLIEGLYIALGQLEPHDRHLINALFFDNVRLRSYAREKGVTHRTVQKCRDQILKDYNKNTF